MPRLRTLHTRRPAHSKAGIVTGGRAERLAPDVLLLTGDAIELAAAAVGMAIQGRTLAGKPPHRGLQTLLAACQPEWPQGDTLDRSAEHAEPVGLGLMTSTEAASFLGCSPRTARRLAARLDGQLVGGRWMLDRHAVQQHLEGQNAAANDGSTRRNTR